MKTTLTILTSLACLSTATAFAQEEETRFRPGELEIPPFATYVDKVGEMGCSFGLESGLPFESNPSRT